MRRTNKGGVVLGLGMLLFAPRASLGQGLERTPVLTTPRFALYSDFDTNLNDALIAAGVARKGGKPELFRSGVEMSCFGKLPQSARAAWNGAVDYYAEIISPAAWSDRQQYLLRVQLAGFDEGLQDAGALEFVEIARSFRAAATPAYKSCRWGAQDERNRRWIEELKSQLAADEDRIAPRLEQLYRKRWSALPHVQLISACPAIYGMWSCSTPPGKPCAVSWTTAASRDTHPWCTRFLTAAPGAIIAKPWRAPGALISTATELSPRPRPV